MLGHRGAVRYCLAELRRGFGSPPFIVAVIQLNQLCYLFSSERMLRQEVCRVLLPENRLQLYSPVHGGLLYPQGVCVEVPKLT